MNGDMNGVVTFLPIGDDGSGRPFGIGDAAPPPVVDVAGDVMTCDPDRVAASDTLLVSCAVEALHK